MPEFKQFMLHCQQRIEKALDQCLPADSVMPEKLHNAMRYAALDGGKRVRPMLVYAAGQAAGADPRLLDSPACAVEMIHVYSLVHDDLPAMDDDNLRRGKPTCHMAYDEATAILAGDALQALAFDVLCNETGITESTRLALIRTLATASGSLGMAGGQAIDLEAETRALELAELESMHRMKTGALIRAAIRMGALCSPEVKPETLDQLDLFGQHIGLAFQIKDDILDETSETEKLGKPQGSDRDRGKSTFVSLCGLETSRQRCESLLVQALQAVEAIGAPAGHLRDLARYIVQRDH